MPGRKCGLVLLDLNYGGLFFRDSDILGRNSQSEWDYYCKERDTRALPRTKEISNKMVERVYSFQSELGKRFEEAVTFVIDSICVETVGVYRSDFQGCELLSGPRVPDETIDVDAGTDSSVPIREWLPVVVQRLIFADLPQGVYGEYRTNVLEALGGVGNLQQLLHVDGSRGRGLQPHPARFCGTIALNREKYERGQPSFDELCFVLAHELSHAIINVRFVVPAFLDWETFGDTISGWLDSDWHDLSDGGLDAFLDMYGAEGERMILERYWPTELVAEWWAEVRGPEQELGT